MAHPRVVLERQGTAFFRAPSGARINVRYGVAWFGFNRQEKILNGSDFRKLEAGMAVVARARMQMWVSQTADVTYDPWGRLA